jgi:hypothetical protein
MSVQAPAALTTDMPSGSVMLTDAEIATFAESIKFAACVPGELLVRTIVARNFEATVVRVPRRIRPGLESLRSSPQEPATPPCR